VSRAAGWRKLVPLLAVGMLAAGVGMEWFGRDWPEVENEEQSGRRQACSSGVRVFNPNRLFAITTRR